MKLKTSPLEGSHTYELTRMLTLKPFTMEKADKLSQGFAQQQLKRQFPHLNGRSSARVPETFL